MSFDTINGYDYCRDAEININNLMIVFENSKCVLPIKDLERFHDEVYEVIFNIYSFVDELSKWKFSQAEEGRDLGLYRTLREEGEKLREFRESCVTLMNKLLKEQSGVVSKLE